MQAKKEIEVEAKTVQEALTIALTKLGVTRKEVEIQVLNEEQKGLFELEGSKKAKIRVILKKSLSKK